jgi:hypothetical protein
MLNISNITKFVLCGIEVNPRQRGPAVSEVTE